MIKEISPDRMAGFISNHVERIWTKFVKPAPACAMRLLEKKFQVNLVPRAHVPFGQHQWYFNHYLNGFMVL